MSNTKIVEMIPKNMPGWMKQAMDEGQLFGAVINHVADLEADNAALTRICKQMLNNRNVDLIKGDICAGR